MMEGHKVQVQLVPVVAPLGNTVTGLCVAAERFSSFLHTLHGGNHSRKSCPSDQCRQADAASSADAEAGSFSASELLFGSFPSHLASTASVWSGLLTSSCCSRFDFLGG